MEPDVLRFQRGVPRKPHRRASGSRRIVVLVDLPQCRENVGKSHLARNARNPT
jgi:hypothetical protein